MSITLLDQTKDAEEYYLAEEKRIHGNPLQQIWLEYTDPSESFFVGIWQSEPGKWHVSYTEEEYCHILAGLSKVVDASTGQEFTLSSGDRFVVPAGFKGTWEVLETTKKHFVVYEKKAASE